MERQSITSIVAIDLSAAFDTVDHDILLDILNIFNLYCAPLEEVIPSNLQISGFADDHSIRDSFKADNRWEELDSKGNIQECMIRIKNWMDQTRLKMNPARMEFIYFGHPRQLIKCTENSIDVTGDLIVRSELIRYTLEYGWIPILTLRTIPQRSVRLQ